MGDKRDFFSAVYRMVDLDPNVDSMFLMNDPMV